MSKFSTDSSQLSVGAILVDSFGRYVFEKKYGRYECLTAKVEDDESMENCLHRMLADNGMEGTIKTFAGVTKIPVSDGFNRIEKSVVWFHCTLDAIKKDFSPTLAVEDEWPDESYEISKWPLFGYASPAADKIVIPDDTPHLIVFDDNEMENVAFTGDTARQSAMLAFEQFSINWKAHLFARVKSNSRDDKQGNVHSISYDLNDYKHTMFQKLLISADIASVADDPFEFLTNQIQAMMDTEFSVKKRVHWSGIPETNSYKSLTDTKTQHIMDRDKMSVTGYVLAKGDQCCLVYNSAVRWLSADELFNFIFTITDAGDTHD